MTIVNEQQTYGADNGDAIGPLMLNLLGAFAEFERALIRERQSEGIRIAKQAGKYLGRGRKLTTERISEAHGLICAGVPKTVDAQKLGVNRATLCRTLAQTVT